MKLIHIARRRLDGLIDPHWVEGFEAYKAQRSRNNCPYTTDTEEFSSWVEGWMEAARAQSARKTVDLSPTALDPRFPSS